MFKFALRASIACVAVVGLVLPLSASRYTPLTGAAPYFSDCIAMKYESCLTTSGCPVPVHCWKLKTGDHADNSWNSDACATENGTPPPEGCGRIWAATECVDPI